jgi:outer membrane protein assembly factor BamB
MESNGSLDAFVLKVNERGRLEWATTWGGEDEDLAASIAVDADGRVLVTGYFSSEVLFPLPSGAGDRIVQGTNDIYLMALNQLGQALWVTTWGSPSDRFELGSSVCVDDLGRILVAGYSGSEPRFNGTDRCLPVSGYHEFLSVFNNRGELTTYLAFRDRQGSHSGSLVVTSLDGIAYLMDSFAESSLSWQRVLASRSDALLELPSAGVTQVSFGP